MPCNRRSNRNSATQHPHKFIFYRRMHYASFRHILTAVFALLHFTPIKMNRRDFAMQRVFNRARYSRFFQTVKVFQNTLQSIARVHLSFLTVSISQIYKILYIICYLLFFHNHGKYSITSPDL